MLYLITQLADSSNTWIPGEDGLLVPLGELEAYGADARTYIDNSGRIKVVYDDDTLYSSLIHEEPHIFQDNRILASTGDLDELRQTPMAQEYLESLMELEPRAYELGLADRYNLATPYTDSAQYWFNTSLKTVLSDDFLTLYRDNGNFRAIIDDVVKTWSTPELQDVIRRIRR